MFVLGKLSISRATFIVVMGTMIIAISGPFLFFSSFPKLLAKKIMHLRAFEFGRKLRRWELTQP